MKRLLLATTLILGTTSAIAQESTHGAYIGGNLGTTINNNQRVDLGTSVGYQFNPYLRTELTYDYRKQNQASNAVMVNVVGQYTIPNTAVTPYVLAGTGLIAMNYAAPAYNVGAGVRLAVSRSVELDARYRYTDTYNTSVFNSKSGDNSFTVGVNYRF